MKKSIIGHALFLLTILLMPLPTEAAPAIPETPTLTPGATTIKVDWTAVADADGYTLYWGTDAATVTSKDNPLKRSNAELGASSPASGETMSFTLTDGESGVSLDSETTYHVAIASFEKINTVESESALSTNASATTEAARTVPSPPSGLVLTSRSDVAITLSWQADTENEVTAYAVTVEKKGGDAFTPTPITPGAPILLDAPVATFLGLEATTRYRFTVTAISDLGSSPPSTGLVVDTFDIGTTTDSLAPNTPDAPALQLLENQAVELTVTGNNEGMADLKHYRIHYETLNDGQDQIFLPTEAVIISGLSLDTRYTFEVSAVDISDNESPQSQSAAILVEEIKGLLGPDTDFDGGCFVTTATGDRPTISPSRLLILLGIALGVCLKKHRSLWPLMVIILLVMAPIPGHAGENTVAIKGGIHSPSDAHFKDIYDGDEATFTLSYQRHLISGLHLGLEAGYEKHTGKKRTGTGGESGAETTLTLAPLSAALTWETPLTPEVILFGGGGLDYWYYREKSEGITIDGEDEGDFGVGGYHGRAGVKLLTTDKAFDHRAGVILETVYSVIDRFGKNTPDLGGWRFSAGIFFIY